MLSNINLAIRPLDDCMEPYIIENFYFQSELIEIYFGFTDSGGAEAAAPTT